MDRDDKVKSTLQRIKWLEDVAHKCMNIEKFVDEKDIDVKMQNNLVLIRLLKQKLQHNRLITKSDMGQCNEILKYIKRKYKFNIDWRGNIESDQYTEYALNKKGNKINIIYSWNKGWSG